MYLHAPVLGVLEILEQIGNYVKFLSGCGVILDVFHCEGTMQLYCSMRFMLSLAMAPVLQKQTILECWVLKLTNGLTLAQADVRLNRVAQLLMRLI